MQVHYEEGYDIYSLFIYRSDTALLTSMRFCQFTVGWESSKTQKRQTVPSLFQFEYNKKLRWAGFGIQVRRMAKDGLQNRMVKWKIQSECVHRTLVLQLKTYHSLEDVDEQRIKFSARHESAKICIIRPLLLQRLHSIMLAVLITLITTVGC